MEFICGIEINTSMYTEEEIIFDDDIAEVSEYEDILKEF